MIKRKYILFLVLIPYIYLSVFVDIFHNHFPRIDSTKSSSCHFKNKNTQFKKNECRSYFWQQESQVNGNKYSADLVPNFNFTYILPYDIKIFTGKSFLYTNNPRSPPL